MRLTALRCAAVVLCALPGLAVIECPLGEFPAIDLDDPEGATFCKDCPVGYFRGDESSAIACEGCIAVRNTALLNLQPLSLASRRANIAA
jgi:hypothetical protein